MVPNLNHGCPKSWSAICSLPDWSKTASKDTDSFSDQESPRCTQIKAAQKLNPLQTQPPSLMASVITGVASTIAEEDIKALVKAILKKAGFRSLTT